VNRVKLAVSRPRRTSSPDPERPPICQQGIIHEAGIPASDVDQSTCWFQSCSVERWSYVIGSGWNQLSWSPVFEP
jgi:hypothetical protein